MNNETKFTMWVAIPIAVACIIILTFVIVASKVYDHGYNKGFNDAIEMIHRDECHGMTDDEIEMRGGDPAPTHYEDSGIKSM